jgi:hypothetical protein
VVARLAVTSTLRLGAGPHLDLLIDIAPPGQ